MKVRLMFTAIAAAGTVFLSFDTAASSNSRAPRDQARSQTASLSATKILWDGIAVLLTRSRVPMRARSSSTFPRKRPRWTSSTARSPAISPLPNTVPPLTEILPAGSTNTTSVYTLTSGGELSKVTHGTTPMLDFRASAMLARRRFRTSFSNGPRISCSRARYAFSRTVRKSVK